MAGVNGFRVVHARSKGVPYLNAFRETRGGLPTGADFRKLLVHSDDYRRVRKVFAAWQLELLGKAADGKRLEPGKDLYDFETGWRGRAEDIKNAKGGDPYAPGAGLSIIPKDFEDGKGNSLLNSPSFDEASGVTVIAESILVPSRLLSSVDIVDNLGRELTGSRTLSELKPGQSASLSCNDVSYYVTIEGDKLNIYVQQTLSASGSGGVVDERTQLAVVGSPGEWKDEAWSSYDSGAILRPGVRGYDNCLGEWRVGVFYVRPSVSLGVLGSTSNRATGAAEKAAPTATGA